MRGGEERRERGGRGVGGRGGRGGRGGGERRGIRQYAQSMVHLLCTPKLDGGITLGQNKAFCTVL